MLPRFCNDRRVVLTLDAGGTSLKFSAIQANRLILGPIPLPSEAHDLDRCLAQILSGFESIRKALPEPPVAISFAFPGPADYPAGIVANIGNLPPFRGGVALGPMLEDRFQLPVFLNNDGDLFAYGESIAGFLPYVNGLLESAGNPKRYRNLFGITIGTGLGGGIVCNGQLLAGDNSMAGEFAGHRIVACQQLAVADDPAAQSGADRDSEQIAVAFGIAGAFQQTIHVGEEPGDGFTVGKQIAVVVQEDGELKPVFEHGAERDAAAKRR